MMSKLLMIVRIAWRSIWRSKRRTLISMFSIVIGTGLPTFMVCLGWGFYNGLIDDVARLMAGHVTYEHVEYRNSPSNDLWVDDIQTINNALNNSADVVSTKQIVILQGVAHTAKGAVGVSLMGVEPSKEITISFLPESIIAGEYLSQGDGRWAIVGSKLAERLNIKVGKKFVFTTNDIKGELVEDLFRVKGIFKTGSNEMDGHFVQSDIDFARMVAGLHSNAASQLGIIVKNPDAHEKILQSWQKTLAKNDGVFLSWKQIMPDIATYIRMDRAFLVIIMCMLVILVLFTMFSTILMSVLERKREFASLLAIGTKHRELNLQIFFETLIFGLIACPLGSLLGIGALKWVEGYDIAKLVEANPEDMSIGGFAMDTVIAPYFSTSLIVQLSIVIFLLIMVLGILPMFLISRISIVDELRA